MAQLEARLDGIEEVEGSNPFGSTKIFSSLLVSTCGLTETCGGRMFCLNAIYNSLEPKYEQT